MNVSTSPSVDSKALALHAVMRYGFSVAGRNSKTKRPWPGCTYRKNTVEGVEELFAKIPEEYKNAGYFVCADATSFILESDDENLFKQKWTAATLSLYGEVRPLPETLTAYGTPNKPHWYFRRNGLSCEPAPICPGIFETRLNNMGVVGFGSPHHSGGTYKLVDPETPVADFPTWGLAVLEYIKDKTPRATSKTNRKGEPDRDGYSMLTTAYISGGLKAMRGLDLAIAFGRHHTMLSVCAFIHNGTYDKDELTEIIEDLWDEYCVGCSGDDRSNGTYRKSENGKSEIDDIVEHVLELHPTNNEPGDMTCFVDWPWVFKNEAGLKAYRTGIPDYPAECLEGDAIAEATHAITDGGGIPPQYVYAHLASVVQLASDFRVGYPNHEDLRMNPYTICISEHPRTGKGWSWKTLYDSPGLAKNLLAGVRGKKGRINILEGTNCGSGQFMVKKIGDLKDEADKLLLMLEEAEQTGTPVKENAEWITQDEIDAPPPKSVKSAEIAQYDITTEADVYRILSMFELQSERDSAVKLNMGEKAISAAYQRDWKKAIKKGEEAIAKILDAEPTRIPRPTDDYLRVWTYFDELLNAYKNGDSSIEELLLTTYERTSVARGSHKNGEQKVDSVSLAFHGDATQKGFEEIFTGRASVNSGFLARCKLVYGEKKLVHNWKQIDYAAASTALNKLYANLEKLPAAQIGGNTLFIPQETNVAKALREEFFSWLDTQNPAFVAELDAHFRRDVLTRVIASGSNFIDVQHIEAAIAWTRYQYALREALYPADHGDVVGQLAGKMETLMDKDPTKSWTDAQFNRHLHFNTRNHGTSEHYVRARSSLLKSHVMAEFGINRKGNYLYQRTDAPVQVSEEDRLRLADFKKKQAE